MPDPGGHPNGSMGPHPAHARQGVTLYVHTAGLPIVVNLHAHPAGARGCHCFVHLWHSHLATPRTRHSFVRLWRTQINGFPTMVLLVSMGIRFLRVLIVMSLHVHPGVSSTRQWLGNQRSIRLGAAWKLEGVRAINWQWQGITVV